MKISWLLILMLIGCSSNQPVASEFCAVAKPIYLAQADDLTVETLKEIIGHNETGRKLCGWK